MSEEKEKNQPPKPEARELDDKELEKVAGGKDKGSGSFLRAIAQAFGKALN